MLDEYAKVPLLEIFPAWVPLPRDPEPPIFNVPALIVVFPLYVFTPVKVSVPEPCFVIAPAPERTPD